MTLNSEGCVIEAALDFTPSGLNYFFRLSVEKLPFPGLYARTEAAKGRLCDQTTDAKIFGTLFLVIKLQSRGECGHSRRKPGQRQNCSLMNRKLITMLIGLSMFLLMMGMQLVQ